MRLLFLFCLISSFCKAQIKGGSFDVYCNFSGYSNGTKFYLTSLGALAFTDSAIIKKGKLYFKGRVAEPTQYRLFTQGGDYRNLWVEKGVISVKGNQADFGHSEIHGSETEIQSEQIEDKISALNETRQHLFDTAVNQEDKKVRSEFLQKVSVLDDSIKGLRIRNLFTLKPTFPLMQELYFLRNSMPKDSLELALKRFPQEIRKGSNGRYIEGFLKTDRIVVGGKAPGLSAKNENGETVRLENFQGKVILLDFWAAWCGPCRLNNRKINSIYSKYKSKNFEVISFNLDTNEAIWLKASREDSLHWVNISDLQGLYSLNAMRYRVQAIPMAFLINKEGIITDIIKGYSDTDDDKLEKKIEYLVDH